MDPTVAQQFWTLEGFAHWELRRLPLLPLIIAGQILFWLSVGAGTALLLWYFPAYYWVTGYVATSHPQLWGHIRRDDGHVPLGPGPTALSLCRP
jgi:hypothetical protein